MRQISKILTVLKFKYLYEFQSISVQFQSISVCPKTFTVSHPLIHYSGIGTQAGYSNMAAYIQQSHLQQQSMLHQQKQQQRKYIPPLLFSQVSLPHPKVQHVCFLVNAYCGYKYGKYLC